MAFGVIDKLGGTLKSVQGYSKGVRTLLLTVPLAASIALSGCAGKGVNADIPGLSEDQHKSHVLKRYDEAELAKRDPTKVAEAYSQSTGGQASASDLNISVNGGVRATNRGASGVMQIGNENFLIKGNVGEHVQAVSGTIGHEFDNGVYVKGTGVFRSQEVDSDYRDDENVNQYAVGLEAGAKIADFNGTKLTGGLYTTYAKSEDKTMYSSTNIFTAGNYEITRTTKEKFEGQENLSTGGKVQISNDIVTAHIAAGPSFNKYGTGFGGEAGVNVKVTEDLSAFAKYSALTPKNEESTQYGEAGLMYKVNDTLKVATSGFYGRGVEEEVGGQVMFILEFGEGANKENRKYRHSNGVITPVPMTDVAFEVTSGEVTKSSENRVTLDLTNVLDPNLAVIDHTGTPINAGGLSLAETDISTILVDGKTAEVLNFNEYLLNNLQDYSVRINGTKLVFEVTNATGMGAIDAEVRIGRETHIFRVISITD